MEEFSRKGETCPQLLDLMSKREWLVKREEEEETSDNKKLELSLGPPGGDWSINNSCSNKHHSMVDDKPLLSFGYISSGSSPWSSSPSIYKVKTHPQQQQQQPPNAVASYIQQLQSSSSAAKQGQMPVRPKESSQSQTCCSKVVDLQQAAAEKKAFSSSAAAANTAVPNSAQKRTAASPVVGWPPIRSFRKNLASSSSSLKSASESPNVVPEKAAIDKPFEHNQKSLFVKINMDGIPIGRKVDVKAYDSYEKLSSAVDELFRGLLAAQSDTSAGAEKAKIRGLSDGSEEYTLVYEDNEGDRMLVGDVPWHMFVSTVKRLRVLKSSELPKLCRGAKQGKPTLDS